jgi:hypothetical protein
VPLCARSGHSPWFSLDPKPDTRRRLVVTFSGWDPHDLCLYLGLHAVAVNQSAKSRGNGPIEHRVLRP